MVLLKYLFYKIRENKFVFVMIMIMAILSTLNLGYRNMWVDEAINVVIGRNITEYGIPKVWDGINLIGASGLAPIPEYDSNLIGYKYDFLPRYLAAFSQLFGTSNYLLRFPFVMMGLVSAILFYILLKKITDNKFVIYSSFIMYALSAQVIVYIRVAYYYAPVLMLMNLTYILFINYSRTERIKWLVCYTVAMIIFYHLNHLFWGVMLLSTILTYFIFFRTSKKRYIVSLMIISIAVIPFAVWRNIIIAGYGGESNVQSLDTFFMQLLGYIWNIQSYIFPFITLSALFIGKRIVGYIIRSHKSNINNDNLRLQTNKKTYNPFIFMLLVTILVNVVAISYFTYDYAARYLLGSIPACYILTALFLEKIFNKDRIGKMLLLALLVTTNILNVLPYYSVKNLVTQEDNYISSVVKPAAPFYNVPWLSENYTLNEFLSSELKIKSYLKEYICGVYTEYNDSTKGIEDFFSKYGSKGDSVYVFGNNSASVIYYTDLRLVVPRDLPDNYQYPAIDLITEDKDYIDWIIVTASGANPYTDEDLFWVRNSIYECYVLNYFNAPCLPEIWNYYFSLPDNLNRLLIYRNVRTTDLIDENDSMIHKVIRQ